MNWTAPEPDPPWDDEGRAALDELALDVVEMYTDSRSGLPATFDDVWISLWPYQSTMRSDYRKRITVSLDDDQESCDEVMASLLRLDAAGHIEPAITDKREGSTEVRYVITAEGRRHLRALQGS